MSMTRGRPETLRTTDDFEDIIREEILHYMARHDYRSLETVSEAMRELARKILFRAHRRLAGLTPIGFSAYVPSGNTMSISHQVQLPWRGLRMVIGMCAPYFIIKDIKVGCVSCTPCFAPMSAESFMELPEGIRYCNLDMKIAMPKVNVTLDVENISAQTSNFTATIFGELVELKSHPLTDEELGRMLKMPADHLDEIARTVVGEVLETDLDRANIDQIKRDLRKGAPKMSEIEQRMSAPVGSGLCYLCGVKPASAFLYCDSCAKFVKETHD